MEIIGPIVLFALFAGLSIAGAYLSLAHHRGRPAGLWAALATALFFAVLGWGLCVLLRSAGVS